MFMLSITIIFCWRLNTKIVEIKSSRKSIEEMIRNFDSAVLKTHKSIADLKHLSSTSLEDIDLKAQKAKVISEDLGYATSSAARLIDRLDERLKEARKFENHVISSSSSKPTHQNDNSSVKDSSDGYYTGGKTIRSFLSRAIGNLSGRE